MRRRDLELTSSGMPTLDLGLWTSLPEPLANLLCPEGAYSVEPETEDQAVFFSESYIEGVVLDGESAAVPAIAERDG